MCFLQGQVEERVVEVPQQDVVEGLTLVGQESIPQRQLAVVPGNAQQENRANGSSIMELSLLTPRPSHHLRDETLVQNNG